MLQQVTTIQYLSQIEYPMKIKLSNNNTIFWEWKWLCERNVKEEKQERKPEGQHKKSEKGGDGDPVVQVKGLWRWRTRWPEKLRWRPDGDGWEGSVVIGDGEGWRRRWRWHWGMKKTVVGVVWAKWGCGRKGWRYSRWWEKCGSESDKWEWEMRGVLGLGGKYTLSGAKSKKTFHDQTFDCLVMETESWKVHFPWPNNYKFWS